jgi:endophilin-B1
MCELQRQLAHSGHTDDNRRGSLQMITSSASEEALSPLPSGKKRARVIFDYNAQDESELSLQANEVILVSQPSDPKADWLMGERGTKQGKVPIAYLEILN